MSFTQLTVGIVLAALAWPASASAGPNAGSYGFFLTKQPMSRASAMARDGGGHGVAGARGGFARGGYVLRDRGGVVRGGYVVRGRVGGYLRIRPGLPCHLKFNTLYFGC